jgi:hypothetical protein
MKKNREGNLTKRDFLILTFVGEQECVRLDTIQQYFELKGISVDIRSVRYSVDRLCHLGFLRKDSLFARRPYVVSAGVEALRIANVPLSRGEKLLVPSFGVALHSIAVARVRLEYERGGGIWTCERRLREDFKNQSHLPDGYVRYGANHFLIEVERTQKSMKRIQNIISANASVPSITEVHYWTPTFLHKFVSEQLTKLHPSIQAKVRVFTLPEEVDR